MHSQNWSARILAAFSRRSKQRPVSVSKLLELKLQLQSLEDRCVPAVFTWVNAAGGTWSTGANWDLGSVPGLTDDAIIPNLPGTPTIDISGGFTAQAQSVTSSELVSIGSLSSLQTGGGTFGRGLDITATNSVQLGTATVAGGNWTGFGVTGLVTNTGSLALNLSLGSASSGPSLTNTSSGTVSVAGSKNLSIGLTNQTGGLVLLDQTSTVSGSITNAGTLRRAVAGTGTVSAGVTNSGAIEVQAGTLSLTGGGTHSGTMIVSAGAVLSLSGGTTTLQAGTAAGGAGVTEFRAGTVNVTGNASFANLQLNNNALTVNIAAGMGLTTTGSSTWTSGATVTGAGTWTNTGTLDASTIGFATANLSGSVTLANQGTLTMQPAGAFVAAAGTTISNAAGASLTIRSVNLDGNLVNAGSATTSAGMNLGTGATISNTATGTYTLSGSGGGLNGAGGNSFTNAGLLRRTAAGTMSVGLPLSNTGTVDVTAGTLNLTGAVAQLTGATFDRTLTAGTWRAAGGILQFPAGNTIRAIAAGATVELSGAGSNIPALIDLSVAGTLNVVAGATLNGGAQGLTVTATGTLLVGAASSLTNYASFFNAGSVTVAGSSNVIGYIQTAGTTLLTGGTLLGASVQGGTLAGTGTVSGDVSVSAGGVLSPGQSPGIITITGNLTLNSGSTTNIEVQGTNPATPDFDRILVSGTATLAGTLNVSLLNGFFPDKSESFRFMTYGSRSGNFTTFNYPLAADGAALFGATPGATFYDLVGTSYVVRNTNDSGAYSLRQAITGANVAAGSDRIYFNIGTGAKTIALTTSALPTITGAVTIDATTQPGFAGTPIVELRGDGVITGNPTSNKTGITIDASSVVIQGFVINRFANEGIWLNAGIGSTIQGNYIGTDIAGTGDKGNGGDGIFTLVGANSNLIVGNLVSGNDAWGILLESDSNKVQGNRVGTNAAGTAALGNSISGVFMYGGSSNIIGVDGNGTGDATEGNLISGNASYGINFQGDSNNNVVAGNFIGTNAAGTAAVANVTGGISFFNDFQADNTRIGTNADGTSDDLERNVISGNSNYGIVDFGVTTVIAGNYVGTKADGLSALANAQGGVSLGGSGATVGGTATAARNVISGNAGFGVAISTATGTGNTILGNFIGTDATGTAAVANTTQGVSVSAGATGNTVGGSNATAVQSFPITIGSGIFLLAFGPNVTSLLPFNATALQVQTALNALTNIGGVGGSVTVTKLANVYTVTFGGTLQYSILPSLVLTENGSAGTVNILSQGRFVGNVISGNTGNGVQITGGSTTGNRVYGNYIGTNAAGTSAVANNVGVFLTGSATGNFIGTDGNGVTDSGEGNVISGNTTQGVLIISADGNRIAGNFIGLNAAGTGSVPNFDGVFLQSTGANIIGTDGSNDAFNASERNYISGNLDRGVVLEGANVVAGNWIGLKPDGTSAGTQQFGVQVTGLGSRVGTDSNGIADTDERNVISGNTNTGVVMSSTSAIIAGNYIGTDSTGTFARPNANGITIGSGGTLNTIGGTTVGARNVISGNLNQGILISGATSTLIYGNFIGTESTGLTRVANGLTGVEVQSAPNTRIGGGAAGQGNVIADPVSVSGAGTTGTRIQGNIIGADKTGMVAIGSIYTVSIGSASGVVVGTDSDGSNDATEGNVIALISTAAVFIAGGGGTTDGNVIAGNLIGTAKGGNALLGTGARAVWVDGATNTRIGGTTAVERNVINTGVNSGFGILLSDGSSKGTTGTVIQGNYIGFDVNGTKLLSNAGAYGVYLGSNNATEVISNTTIGGTTVGARNVIGGFVIGVNLDGAGDKNNTVSGNYIGTDKTGGVAKGNAIGVQLSSGASNNTIGGTTAGARNVISGNTDAGVLITGSGTTGNVVFGNTIGLGSDGSTTIANKYGVWLDSSASNNRVGGGASGAGNVISGNTTYAVYFTAAGTSNNKVQGNLIGLANIAGFPTRPNGGALGNAIQLFFTGSGNIIGTDSDGTTDVEERNVISGNTNVGVWIKYGSGGNTVAGNYIGTDPTGLLARPNGNGVAGDGIDINNSPNNVVGGLTAVAKNLISGNDLFGVVLEGALTTGTVVQGNWIGVDVTGNAKLGNAAGVGIQTGASSNTVGGTTAATRNIISGNTNEGVQVTGAGTTGNRVYGNYIGTKSTGAGALGNNVGVFIGGGATNTNIGGSTPTPGTGSGNVISGNQAQGVLFSGTTGTGNKVQGNIIGLGANGDTVIGNGLSGPSSGPGVQVVNSTGLVLIGGPSDLTAVAGGVRNVIAGNPNGDIAIGNGTAANPAVIQGNYIGTDITGTALRTTSTAILVGSAVGLQIGGSGANEGNLIAGGFRGINVAFASSDGTTIQGNRIGTDKTGTQDIGATTFGIRVSQSAKNTLIGGTTAGAMNLIAGNTTGIRIDSNGGVGSPTNVLIQGNRIGTKLDGLSALANGTGIELADSATGVTIGGTTAGARNVISGNTSDGVLITGVGTAGNTVLGNYIGTDLSGSLDLGNAGRGVQIDPGANGNVIGGLAVGAGNVISGNDGVGVVLESANNLVLGNYIGTNATGTAAVGNGVGGVGSGVGVLNAAGNQIGGTTAAARNVISGNAASGIALLFAGTTGTLIQGNFIGTNATGTGAVGNEYGITILAGAANNIVGGSLADTSTGLGNLVAFNGTGTGYGIYLDATVSGNTVRFNRVYSNGGLSGIVNDSNNPNTPTLTAALGGNSSRIFGGFQGVAGKSYLVDFYTSDAGGTAKVYLGSTTYLANGVGTVTIDSIFPGAMPFTTVITATATRTDTGSTSGLANGTPALGAIIQGIPLNAVEGTPITLTAFTVLDTTGLSYRWSILKNGVPYADSVGSFTPVEAGVTFIPDDNGTYTVTLKLTSGSGGTSTVGPVAIGVTNALPRPELRLTADQVQAGLVVVAQAVGNDPGTADVVTFVWQVWFGPAVGAPLASGTGDNFSFTPTFNGFYRLRLTATDDDGGVAVVERLVESRGAIPVASITLITSGNEGDPVQARAQLNEIANGEDLVFEWKVTKNGVAYTPITTPTAGAVQFVPNDQGSYRIDLRVRSLNSGLTTDAAPVYVTPGNAAPVVSIVAPTLPVLAGAPVTFISKATDPGSLDTLSYQWTAAVLGSTVQYGGIGQNFTFTPGVVGQYQVSLTVTDNSSASATASQFFVVTAGNITLGINGFPTLPIAEGTPLTLTAAVAAGSYRYDWAVTKDGMPYLTASSRTLANPTGFVAVPLAFPFSPDDNGKYEVTLQVTLPTGETGVRTQSFKAFNMPLVPTITASAGPYIEGVPILFTAAPNDPGTADTHSYKWKINGVSYGANPANPSVFKFVPPDNGSYTASVTVTDDEGLPGSVSITPLTVLNANPVLSIRSGAPVAGKVSLALDWRDVPADSPTAATWKLLENGTQIQTGGGYTLSYAPATGKRYTISWTAGDEDGGSSTITIVSLVGTAGNDTRVITAADVVGVDALIYQGLAGNDNISVAAGITTPVILDGGDGDDTLSGGDGNDVLIAGIGKNILFGGKGNDLFIGGGSDTMNGGAGDDRYMVHFSEVQLIDTDGGTDTVDFSGITTSGVTVRFDGNPAYQFPFAGNTTSKLSLVGSFEGVVGTSLADKISINTSNITVFGGEGDDNVTVDGTAKDVTILSGGGVNGVSIGGGELIRVFGGDGDENVTVDGTAKDVTISTGGGINGVSITGGELIRVFGGEGDENVTVGVGAKDVTISTGGGVNGVSVGGGELIRVFGGEGDENVTVDGTAKDVTISTGGGKNGVSITGGELIRVFGGEGDENVTVGVGAKDVTISTGGGVNGVSIGGGELIQVFGGDGNENVTVGTGAKDVTISTGGGINGVSIGGGELIRVFGGDGDENVTVDGTAKDVIISTGGGKNGVSITGGELIRVFGGDGDENVTVDGTAKDVIISTGGGINNVSIGGGELIRVFGDVGVENVTVNGASNNVLISTGGGKDTVSIGGGNLVTVFTGDGDDNVTISGGTNLLLAAGEGNDKILVTDGVTLILLGDGGNDLVTVSGGDLISVYGGEGDDAATVSGTAKHVLVSGWNGIDSVSIGGGDLITAVGGVGKDNFMVTGGTRILIGGGLDNDNFSITGGDSVAVFGGDGDDNVTVGGGTHVIVVGDQGNDHFMVTGGDLITVFGGLNDDDVLVNTVTGRVEVLGSEGNDKIQVLKGTQISADGGSGDDAITVSGGDQITVFGGTGNDAVSVSGGLFIKVLGGSGNDSVTVSGGTNVTVNGGTGNDVIAANSPLASNIVLFGDSGNDVITADQPNGITVSGGRGDDYLLLGRGVDVVAYGDDGNDTYIFLNTGVGNVKLKELINLDSSNLDQPSRGDDFVDFSAFTTPATFNLGLIGSELDPNTGKQVVNGVTIWLFGSFEGIYGTSANDLLIGNEKDNQIYGLGGNDTIYGLGGNDTLVGGLGDDSLIGGTGNDWYAFYGTSVESDVVVEAANLDVDTLDFSGRGVAVTVDLSSTAVQTYDGSSKIQLSSSTGLENIVGTNFADTLTGNSRDNQIAGLGGNDTLTGAAGDDVYYFAGSNAGTDRVVETAADAGSDTLDFSGFLAPIQLDLAVTSTQSFGTFGGVQLSDGMGIENVVGTGYADRLFGNSRPNAIHGAGGADYIDGRDGNDNLYGGLTQVVFLDFATGTELPRGDFDYLNTAAPTGGVSAADAIIARLNTIFTGLDYRFTRNLADAQAWTATSGREFVTLVFNDGPGGGIGGESNEIDFRNLVRDGRGTINVNDLLGGTTQPAKTVANVIALTSTIAAHELGHMAGLRHGDAFGPIGSGLYAGIGASYLDQITPTYTGLFNAVYTPLHILASPLSVGTTLFDATQATYFGERELIKLSFADTGTAIREASATPGSHGTFSTATALGVLPALNVFNTIGAREAGYVPAAGQNFDWMNVSALSVSGNLDAVAGLAEKDVYSFYGTAGDIINIELISSSIRPALSNPIDGVLRVYDANGTLLYESDNDFESADANVFDLRLLTSGLFYIEVTSKTPTDTGRYEMFVTRFGPRTPNLQPLGLGDTIVGGAGSDMMYGTTANDTFRLGAVNPGDADVIDGRLGDDLFDGAGFAGANVQLFRITRSLSAVTLPTLAPIAAMTVNEGQTLTFTTAGSTTATGDRLTYSLAPAATGLFPNGASIDPNTGKFTFIPTNQGAFSVKVIVASASGLTAERTFTITANNVAPTLTLNGLATLYEAGTWTGGGTATDPGLDTLTVTVNYGDGSGWLPVVLGTDHKYQLSHVYGDNGNYTVTVRGNDGDGGSDEKALPVVVTNVAPTATLSNAGDVTEGTVGVAAVRFTNATDVSGVDATSLRFAYDFNNDGVWDLGTGTYAGSVTSASAVIPTLYINNGLLTRTVKARVIDKDGGYTDYLTSFTVFNAPPTATINGPLVVTINEGSLLNLTGTGSDVGQDTLTYLWTALGAFDKTPHTSTTTGLSFTPLDDDQYTVTFTVTDSDGASVTKTVQVNVLNVAPTLTVGSVATVQPGVPFSRTVTFTDPGADTWTAEVNYGDGGGWQPIAINTTKQIALSHTYATGGNYTLQVRVTDDNGGTDTKSFPVVSNLPPVASVVGPANGVRGQVRTFTLSATDYVGDVTAGFEYRVNWGDGSPVQIVTRTANNVSTPLTHTYMTLGNFTVSVLAVDQYGAISPAVTTVIPILVAALQTSGGITTLAVGGGNDSERIRLKLKEGATDYIVVKINDLDVSQFRWKQSYPADLIQKIEVYGNGGDDDIRVDDDLTLPTLLDGGAGNDTIEGGSGNDTIYGGLGNDEIEGNDGNDVIYGGDGNDEIEGGDGNDVIDAGSGNNCVDGGDGNDTITAGSGNDTIDGGDGNDLINAGDGNNCVDGGDGNDTITAGSGNDTIDGGCGNDLINARNGNNCIDGGDGNDTITAGTGNDTIDGGDGNDVINAGDGNNWVDGGCGNDTITAGSGSDTLYGGDGNDLIRAGAGNDTLDGGAGNDILLGGDGNDMLVGGDGRDLLIGGFGADRLNGNSQDDILIAGYTSFDDNDGALSNIMAEWTSSGSYTSRVNNLTNGTGASGGVRLIGDDGATQTVFNDNDVDTLIGSSGQDWFFANTINDNGGAIDIVVDAAGNEIVRDTDY